MTPMISSYVFFDIETTGLPYQEKNRTKIIELSLVSALRKDIECTPFGHIPPVSKLSFLLNPKRNIHPKVTELTGLSNELLKNAPVFGQKIHSLITFLEELPKPVCLVAHNGNAFDFKVLLAECNDVCVSLPGDLLCLDSLIGFRKMLKGSNISFKTLTESPLDTIDTTYDEILTDDEDDWPDLNVSPEEWQEIDDICLSFSDVSCEENSDTEQIFKQSNNNNGKEKLLSEKVMQIVFNSNPKVPKKAEAGKESYTLSALYKKLINKGEINAHRAEADCLMLLQCVVAIKNDFLLWSDSAYKSLHQIQPLISFPQDYDIRANLQKLVAENQSYDFYKPIESSIISYNTKQFFLTKTVISFYLQNI